MILYKIIIYIILILITIIYFSNAVIVRVKIKNGSYLIRGKTILTNIKPITYFGRIPYAKPPIGKLRFQNPEELDRPPSKNIYDGREPPDSCWQGTPYSEFDKNNAAANMWFTKRDMSEDCLFLSIWIPDINFQNNSRKYPVMVWIYGGSYMAGSNTLEVYNGSVLASTENVVIVSLQFRMGPLGFLNLGSSSRVAGNQALLDQRVALRWIQSNIAAFGGDPNKVTLFGESSGATSISIHMFAEKSQQYFQRAILQSGTILAPWAIENVKGSLEKSHFFANSSNCSSSWKEPNDFLTKSQSESIVQCLQRVPPSQIVNNNYLIRNFIAQKRKKILNNQGYHSLYSDAALFFDIYFRPVYSQEFVSQEMMQRIQKGNLTTRKDVFLGTNSNEGIFFILYGLSSYFSDFFTGSQATLPRSLEGRDPYKLMMENMVNSNMMRHSSMIKLIMLYYGISSTQVFGDDMSNVSIKTLLEQLDRMSGDEQFICSTQQFADSLSQHTKVYMYQFDYRTQSIPVPDWCGIMHGYEIEYVFGSPFNPAFTTPYYSFSTSEQKTSLLVMKLWANFAKFGDPTQDGLGRNFYWPQYSQPTRRYVRITNKVRSVLVSESRFKSKTCLLWTTILPKFSSLFNAANQNISLSNQILVVLVLIFNWFMINTWSF